MRPIDAIIGAMSEPAPDWIIHIPGSSPSRLTARQRELLDGLEDVLRDVDRTSRDEPAIRASITPIVRALTDAGMSPDEIADNSRLRPQFVRAIVSGDAHDELR